MLESKNNKQRINLSKKRFFLLSLLLVTVLLTVILSSCFLLNKPPHKPTLSYPKNLANEIPATDLTLKWSCYDPDGNKLNYTLYLSPSSTPTLYATNIISNQYTIHKTLKGHTLYSWKVIANDGHGAKSSSDIYKFTTSDNPPTKPALTYPDNNQTDVATSNLTLKWNPSTDPDGDPITYDLYLSTDSNPKLYKSNLTDTQYTISTLQHGTLYSWKVIAKDDHGAKSSSGIYKFTTSDNPPTQATLTYPDNNQTDVATSSLTLTWNPSTDPDGDPITYDLYLSTDSNPTIYATNITDTQYTIPTALNGHTTYYWKVIANDGHTKTATSDVYSFTTKDNPPTQPALTYPDNNQTNVVTSNLTLKWNSSTDPDGDPITYDLYLSTDSNPKLYKSNLTDTQYTIPTALNGHTTYYWKVIANDGYTKTATSDVYSFTTNNLPTLPLLIYPPNEMTAVSSSSVKLIWNPSTDPDGDTVTYTLMFGTSKNELTEKATDIHTTSYVVDLNPHITYYWQIIANDGYGGEAKSDVYSFATKDTPPTQPALTYPDNNQTNVVTSNLTLTWKPSTDPDGDPITYDLYLSTDSNPTIYATNITDTQYTIPTALNGHATYYWKVVANDGHTKTATSDTYSFTTSDNPPAKPQLIYPRNNAEKVTVPSTILKWKPSTDLDEDTITYTVMFGMSATNLVQKATNIFTTSYTINGLTKNPTSNTYYYWQIIANDGYGGEATSDVYSFTTKDTPPTKPNLVSPTLGENNVSQKYVNLHWNPSTDNDGDTLIYTLMMGSSPDDLIQKATNIHENNYILRDLNIGYYYWQIIANDGYGGEAKSDIWYFQTVSDGTLKWSYKTDSYITSSPAIASDGTVYVGSWDDYLYAINPDRTLKWKYKTGAEIYTSPAIASDGTIYIGSNDHYLYAINPDRTLKWKHGTGGGIHSSPAIASDGTIYIGSNDHYLYAINPDGTLKWKYGTGDFIYSSPAIASDGTVYVGSYDNCLYAINPDGTLKWKYKTGYYIFSSPAIASDGTVYVGSKDHYLYAINPDGTLKWKYKTGEGIGSSPAIGSDGTVYVGSKDHYLYAINPDGTLKWKYKTGEGIGSSPAIGSDGTVYVGSWDDYLYAINPDGTLKWKYGTGSYISSSPAIGSDGTIYVGSDDNYLYAIKTNNGGLADSPWPMFKKGLKHTSNFKLILGNHPPTKPTLTYPDNNQTDVATSNLTLKWNASIDPDGDPITYDLYLSTDSTPIFYAADLLTNQFQIVETLKAQTIYYWKVVAKDGKGGQISSAVWKFKTKDSSSSEPITSSKGWLHIGYSLNNVYYYPYASQTGSNNLNLLWQASHKGIVLTGDINNDGELEVVSAIDNQFYVFDPNGNALWNKDLSGDSGDSNVKVNYMDLDDVNEDNIPEIIVGINTLKLLIYSGNGDLLKIINLPNAEAITGIKCADLNGDGKKEIIVSIFTGYGLQPRSICAYEYTTGEQLWHYDVGPIEYLDAIADINGDGKKEIIVGSFAPHNGNSINGTDDFDSYVFVLDKDGHNIWTKKLGWDRVICSVADLNEDGKQEIIVFRYQNAPYYPGPNNIYILDPQNGNILYTYEGPSDKGWKGFAIADINGDGKKEIVVGNRDGKIRILDDHLQLIKSINLSGTVEVINDINGDGKEEVIVGTDNKKIVVLDNNLNELSEYTLGDNIREVIISPLTGETNEIIASADQLYVLNTLSSFNNPPTRPILKSPENNATGVDTSNVTFKWNTSTDSDGDTITYDLYLSTNSNPALYKSRYRFKDCVRIITRKTR